MNAAMMKGLRLYWSGSIELVDRKTHWAVIRNGLEVGRSASYAGACELASVTEGAAAYPAR